MIVQDGHRFGYEIKYTDAPRLSPSMRIAMHDLKLDSLRVIYPGQQTFPLGEKVRAMGLNLFLRENPSGPTPLPPALNP